MKKRMVTEIMARNPEAITLAIGDGANDTDMIMAAHVGVGIAGVEGTAAVNSADYAVGTFRMLHELLFVHGFWSYHRIAMLVNFIFYKAVLLATSAYWFGFFSGFAGQQFYNDPPLQLYNVVYTALPVMFVAIWDQVLSRDVLSNNPVAYREAKGKAFDKTIFFGWVMRAIVHGLILYFLVHGALVSDVADPDGKTHGLWYFSTVIYYAIVVLPSVFIIIEMHTISVLQIFALFSSFGSLFLFTFIMSEILSLDRDLFKVVARLYGDGAFWFSLILVVAIPVLMEIFYRGLRQHLRPSFTQIIREKQLVAPDKQAKKSIKINPNEEKDWVARKPTNKRITKSERTSVALRALNKTTEKKGDHTVDDMEMKGGLIRAMLRFRNLTGSSFDSAAEAGYQEHDLVFQGEDTTQSGAAPVDTSEIVAEVKTVD
jgi:magnesium-transporting ATPase (P-type)